MGFIDTIGQIFHQGGVLVMSSILFVLLAVIVIIIERSYRFWLQYDLANSSSFMASLQQMIMNNSIENAIRLCKKAKPRLTPYVLSAGLMRANDTADEIDNALHAATMTALPKVNRGINFIGTSANVATLLGLLGTIFGLMKSFGGAANATGAEKQTILAEGISEALTATSFGLGTALFCILAHGILAAKQQAILGDINQNSAKLNDLLFTRQVKLKIRG